MIQSKKKWVLEHIDQQQAERFAEDLQISVMAAKLLLARGVDTPEKAQDYLHTDASMSHDPFLFTQMKPAVERIKQAIATNERILVYGDYDAGATRS